MANSGLDLILKYTFGGVAKMLIGKKYPQNVGVLRVVTEEVLREMITGIEDEDDLDDKVSQSKTTKLCGWNYSSYILNHDLCKSRVKS